MERFQESPFEPEERDEEVGIDPPGISKRPRCLSVNTESQATGPTRKRVCVGNQGCFQLRPIYSQSNDHNSFSKTGILKDFNIY